MWIYLYLYVATVTRSFDDGRPRRLHTYTQTNKHTYIHTYSVPQLRRGSKVKLTWVEDKASLLQNREGDPILTCIGDVPGGED